MEAEALPGQEGFQKLRCAERTSRKEHLASRVPQTLHLEDLGLSLHICEVGLLVPALLLRAV